MKNCIKKITRIALKSLVALSIFAIAFLGVFSAPLMNVANVLADGAAKAGVKGDLKLINMPKTAKLGENVIIPKGTTTSSEDVVSIKVFDPKGNEIATSASGENFAFNAELMGAYTVKYILSNSSTQTLFEKEYKISVTGQRAEIKFAENDFVPSVVNGKYQIVLPNPTIKEADETDGNLDNLKITIKGTYEGALTYTSTLAGSDYFIKKVDNHFAFTPDAEQDCTYYVTYSYKSNGLETTKVFEIKYEKEFDETKIDLGYKLSGSMPESLELGVETKLPTVSIYDKNDEDLKLDAYTDIEVIFVPNSKNASKYANKLESGKDYVLVSKDGKVKAMYPSSEGRYEITYNISSFYSKAQNKVDKTLKYAITNVKDSTAPTTYVVEDYAVIKNADNKVTGVAEDYEPKDVSYRIPSKVATGTVVCLPAIYADDNFSSYGDLYSTLERVVINEKGNKTSITKCLKEVNSQLEEVDVNPYETCSYKFEKAGTYTIRYEATDKANKYNYTGTTFTIVVEDGFSDTIAPRITMPTIAKYVKQGEKITFNKAKVIDYASDTPSETKIIDQNLDISYYYYTGTIADLESEIANPKASANLIEIKEDEDDNTKLTMIAPSSDFSVICIAVDDSSNRGYRQVSVKIKDETDNIAPTISTSDTEYVEALEDENLSQDETIVLPTLKINDNKANSLEASIEILDKDGKKVSVTGAKYNYDGTDYKISNARFVATKSGEYTITYTIEDIGGNYVVKSYFVNIDDTKAPTIELNSYISSVEVGETVTLPTIIVKDDGEVVENAVTEVRFVGDNNPSYKFNTEYMEFTALEEGVYTFEYYAKDLSGNETISGPYTITAKDTQKPVIELDEEIDLYNPITKDSSNNIQPIIIPGFTATDILNGLEGEPKVTVKSPKGKELEVTKTTDGKYSFVPTDDGIYTIEYSATDKANNTTTKSYSMKVGDITKPSISIEENSSNLPKDMKAKSVLKLDLEKISVSDAGETKTAKELLDLYTNNGNQRFVVKIVGPNSQTISADDGKEYEYTLKETGTYTIKFIARDEAGNENIKEVSFQVFADENKSVVSTETWSIVLIVLSLAILAGVVIYFVKTRDKKPTKPQPRLNNENKENKD